MLDVLNRPAILLGALAVATLVGYAFGRARGVLRGALLAIAAWGALVAVKATRWMPDAGGWLAAGLAVAATAIAIAWWLPSARDGAS